MVKASVKAAKIRSPISQKSSSDSHAVSRIWHLLSGGPGCSLEACDFSLYATL